MCVDDIHNILFKLFCLEENLLRTTICYNNIDFIRTCIQHVDLLRQLNNDDLMLNYHRYTVNVAMKCEENNCHVGIKLFNKDNINEKNQVIQYILDFVKIYNYYLDIKTVNRTKLFCSFNNLWCIDKYFQDYRLTYLLSKLYKPYFEETGYENHKYFAHVWKDTYKNLFK